MTHGIVQPHPAKGDSREAIEQNEMRCDALGAGWTGIEPAIGAFEEAKQIIRIHLPEVSERFSREVQRRIDALRALQH
jgi:hypothetical protein